MKTDLSQSSAKADPFKQGTPRFATEGGDLIVYEIQLKPMGDRKEPVVLRATLDLSRQYAAEGIEWTAQQSGGGFLRGETIPRHQVSGWRDI